MSNYHAKDFQARWNDPDWSKAERVFEEVWPTGFERVGLDRTTLSINKWSIYMRYEPDYRFHGGRIEVKGFGRDRVVKIKDDNRIALRWYAEKDPVTIFFWDSAEWQWGTLNWQVVDEMLDTPYSTGIFDEKNRWGGLHFDQLNEAEIHWTHYEPKKRRPSQLGS